MTVSNFQPSVTKIKGYEGGFSDLAKDPGGATNWGVTESTLSAYRGHACTVADVRALTWAEAEPIYHEVYWPAVLGDQLPPGVDLITFDAGINCGRGRAVTFLQAALGVEQDGQLGPVTLAKLAAVSDLHVLLDKIEVARAAYYRALKTYATFGKGWMARLSDVTNTAVGWAAQAA